MVSLLTYSKLYVWDVLMYWHECGMVQMLNIYVLVSADSENYILSHNLYSYTTDKPTTFPTTTTKESSSSPSHTPTATPHNSAETTVYPDFEGIRDNSSRIAVHLSTLLASLIACLFSL